MTDGLRELSLPTTTLVSVGLLAWACAGGQTTDTENPIVVGDDPACENCSIELEKITRLGSFSDPGSPALFANVSYRKDDGSGQFFVAPVQGAGQILIFSDDGDVVRTLGESGDGPGQFSTGIIRVEFGPDGEIYVLDRSLQRLTIFADDLTFRATQRLPFAPPMDLWVLSEDRRLVQGWRQGQLRSDRQRGFHVYSADHDLVSSTGRLWQGPVPRSYKPETATLMGSDYLWASMRRQYRFTQWSVYEEQPVRTLIRTASWFPVDTSVAPEFQSPYIEKPDPFVRGVMSARKKGYLWVLIDVADVDWTPRELGTEQQPLTPENADFNGVFDTILEVIDTDAGEVVVRKRVDQALRPVRSNDSVVRFYSYDVTDGNLPVIDIWQPELHMSKGK